MLSSVTWGVIGERGARSGLASFWCTLSVLLLCVLVWSFLSPTHCSSEKFGSVWFLYVLCPVLTVWSVCCLCCLLGLSCFVSFPAIWCCILRFSTDSGHSHYLVNSTDPLVWLYICTRNITVCVRETLKGYGSFSLSAELGSLKTHKRTAFRNGLDWYQREKLVRRKTSTNHTYRIQGRELFSRREILLVASVKE